MRSSCAIGVSRSRSCANTNVSSNGSAVHWSGNSANSNENWNGSAGAWNT